MSTEQSTRRPRRRKLAINVRLGQEARRWILFSFSFLCVSLVAGLVYGWPALRQQILADGSDLTEKQLGAIFTVGAWSTQGGRFLTGLARDRYGTRLAACWCLVCTAAGSLGIALSDASNVASLASSLFFLGIGSGTQLCVQPVAGLFPKHAGAVLSTLSGAFQVSGLIFLILANVSSSRKGSYLGFAFFVVGLTVIAALLLPSGGSFVLEEKDASDDHETKVAAYQGDPVTVVSDAGVSEPERTMNDESVVDESEARKDKARSNAGLTNDSAHENNSETTREVEDFSESERMINGESIHETQTKNGVLLENTVKQEELQQEEENDDETNEKDEIETHPPTVWQQLRTREYLGLLIWFSVCIVPLQYYVGTIGFQLEEKGDDGFYTDLFSITYACAAVVAPVGGYLADKCSLGIAHVLATTLTAASLFILASPASLDAQVVGLICYGVGRMLTFGMYFSNVGKRFGYTNYGTLAGLGLITSAIISLLQYPLIAWAADGHSVPVNVSCGSMLMAVTPYCYWLHRQERRYGKAPSFKKNFLTGNT